ncbi:unnamed protein product [Zymoseptoria tritici ST99CH_1E4]|uniref:ARS-binding protein 2 n=1 Tax=Zymoseptoria tritici ST99CH_1E4 TaxID=1276532 RepID=A0A2H1FXC8_ZYMTR|nr:unnamed protein product [Zymoseptoria tritici ST99CH_1E4]
MYRPHDHGAGAEQQFHLSPGPGHSPYAQSQLATPVYGLDPNIHGSPPQRLHPGLRQAGSRQSSHGRTSSSDMQGQMQPPSGTSPRMSSATPAAGYTPLDRSLPSRDVTADTITDAFVDFILYCNPHFPLDVDTSTLRTNFESPPKSDGKDFETFRLFELIKKFDAKELKTWGQLALDLGVEAPDVSKGQSVQKVQQYSVRLKRWMRAMHIDAFFEFLLGKQHSYATEIPPPNDPYPTTGRDGVMAEEDLAIRALDPAFRPKRGRRRNSETEQDDATSDQGDNQTRQPGNAAQFSQQQMSTPLTGAPFSAHPDAYNDPWAVASAVTPQSFAPWSGRPSAGMTPSNLRWQLGPNSPHPMTSIPTSMSAHIDAALDGEPKSAVTPSSSRKRRRHGPAVSSAWPSAHPPGAKPRGRPPANRNTQDGPFGTFPADPGNNDKDKGQGSTSTEPQTIIEQPSPQLPQMFQSPSEGRPGRLSLQVPARTGGPVRLATPPMVLVNGEQNENKSAQGTTPAEQNLAAASQPRQSPSIQTATSHNPSTTVSTFTFETLKRVLTSDLLRSDIHNRRNRLTGDEAKRLATSILTRLSVPNITSPTTSGDIARITAASWLGVGDQYNVPLGPAAGHGKKINVTRFCVGSDGYEEIVYDEGIVEGVREVFDLYWQVSLGGCMGNFEMKGLSLASLSSSSTASEAPVTETTHDLVLRKGLEAMYKVNRDGWVEESMSEIARSAARNSNVGDDSVDWKARCKALEFAAHVAKGEVERLKKRTVEKLLDAVL